MVRTAPGSSRMKGDQRRFHRRTIESSREPDSRVECLRVNDVPEGPRYASHIAVVLRTNDGKIFGLEPTHS